jgi:hypothetical protein
MDTPSPVIRTLSAPARNPWLLERSLASVRLLADGRALLRNLRGWQSSAYTAGRYLARIGPDWSTVESDQHCGRLGARLHFRNGRIHAARMVAAKWGRLAACAGLPVPLFSARNSPIGAITCPRVQGDASAIRPLRQYRPKRGRYWLYERPIGADEAPGLQQAPRDDARIRCADIQSQEDTVSMFYSGTGLDRLPKVGLFAPANEVFVHGPQDRTSQGRSREPHDLPYLS